MRIDEVHHHQPPLSCARRRLKTECHRDCGCGYAYTQFQARNQTVRVAPCSRFRSTYRKRWSALRNGAGSVSHRILKIARNSCITNWTECEEKTVRARRTQHNLSPYSFRLYVSSHSNQNHTYGIRTPVLYGHSMMFVVHRTPTSQLFTHSHIPQPTHTITITITTSSFVIRYFCMRFLLFLFTAMKTQMCYT